MSLYCTLSQICSECQHNTSSRNSSGFRRSRERLTARSSNQTRMLSNWPIARRMGVVNLKARATYRVNAPTDRKLEIAGKLINNQNHNMANNMAYTTTMISTIDKNITKVVNKQKSFGNPLKISCPPLIIQHFYLLFLTLCVIFVEYESKLSIYLTANWIVCRFLCV